MFGRHVQDRSTDKRRGSAGSQLGVLREIEVEQHRLAVVRHQDVRGFEVAVQDAPLVRACWSPAASRAPSQSTAST